MFLFDARQSIDLTTRNESAAADLNQLDLSALYHLVERRPAYAKGWAGIVDSICKAFDLNFMGVHRWPLKVLVALGCMNRFAAHVHGLMWPHVEISTWLD